MEFTSEFLNTTKNRTDTVRNIKMSRGMLRVEEIPISSLFKLSEQNTQLLTEVSLIVQQKFFVGGKFFLKF